MPDLAATLNLLTQGAAHETVTTVKLECDPKTSKEHKVNGLTGDVIVRGVDVPLVFNGTHMRAAIHGFLPSNYTDFLNAASTSKHPKEGKITIEVCAIDEKGVYFPTATYTIDKGYVSGYNAAGVLYVAADEDKVSYAIKASQVAPAAGGKQLKDQSGGYDLTAGKPA